MEKKIIKEFAFNEGADLVGVASIKRFSNAPLGHKPQDILPKAKSVIVLAMQYLNGSIEPAKIGSTIYPYQASGHIWLNHQLTTLAYKVARFLERKGFLATPIPANWPRYWEEPKGIIADLSHKHAAVAAGLGEFGWSGLVLTPQFGPRQRFISIITNAPIEEDPIYNEKICTKCFKCVEVCPVKAISKTKKVSIKIDERIFEYGFHDKMKCKWCNDGGLLKTAWGMKTIPMPKKIDFKSYWNALEQRDPYQKAHATAWGSTTPFCGKCLIHCPIGENINKNMKF